MWKLWFLHFRGRSRRISALPAREGRLASLTINYCAVFTWTTRFTFLSGPCHAERHSGLRLDETHVRMSRLRYAALPITDSLPGSH